MRLPQTCLPALLLALCIPQANARTHHHRAPADSGKPVILTQEPGTDLDKQARKLNQSDLSASAAKGDTPIVLVGSAPLSANREDVALFVQLQSARLCGSAGCSTSIYLGHHNEWTKILDSVSGTINVLKSQHNGLHDLLVGKQDKWTWDGHTYQDTMAAPAIPNLRQSVEQHQKDTGQH